jgi:hypothetical protein
LPALISSVYSALSGLGQSGASGAPAVEKRLRVLGSVSSAGNPLKAASTVETVAETPRTSGRNKAAEPAAKPTKGRKPRKAMTAAAE